MRIHPSAHAGSASWEIYGKGVREVMVRATLIGVALVSYRGGPLIYTAGRGIRDFAPHTTTAFLTDLFASETAARAEYDRRGAPTHAARDRTSPRLPAAWAMA